MVERINRGLALPLSSATKRESAEGGGVMMVVVVPCSWSDVRVEYMVAADPESGRVKRGGRGICDGSILCFGCCGGGRRGEEGGGGNGRGGGGCCCRVVCGEEGGGCGRA